MTRREWLMMGFIALLLVISVIFQIKSQSDVQDLKGRVTRIEKVISCQERASCRDYINDRVRKEICRNLHKAGVACIATMAVTHYSKHRRSLTVVRPKGQPLTVTAPTVEPPMPTTVTTTPLPPEPVPHGQPPPDTSPPPHTTPPPPPPNPPNPIVDTVQHAVRGVVHQACTTTGGLGVTLPVCPNGG